MAWDPTSDRSATNGPVAGRRHSGQGDADVPTPQPDSRDVPGRRVVELESRLAHLLSLFRQMAEMTATLNYERVLDLSLDAPPPWGQTRAGDRCAAALRRRDLTIASSRGLPVSDQRATFAAAEGALEQALRTGVIQVTQDPSHDPELRRLAAMGNCRVAACLPLVVGLDAFGVMVFADPRPELFTTDRLELRGRRPPGYRRPAERKLSESAGRRAHHRDHERATNARFA
jgi:hypothetical protein